MTLRKSLLLSASFVVFLAVAAAPSFGYSAEFDQLYPLRSGGSFELQNVNGTVEVQGWDRSEVEVHAVKTATRRPSDTDLVSIEVNAHPGDISVSTRYPEDQGVEVAVEYDIHVPHGARIEHLGTVNGALRISGVYEVEDLHTVNGDIEVYEAGGDVHAHTTNGNVHLELANFRGPDGASAETTNGSVLLAVPPDTHADLVAICLNGNFRSELPLQEEESLKPRETHGKLGKGGVPIRLRTINGGIRVVALRSTV
jgi:Toastrack DUF4097